MSSNWKKYSKGALLTCLALVATGCGSSVSSVNTLTPETVTVSGKAVKGPISSAIVTVFTVGSDGAEKDLLGTGVTKTDGSYDVKIPKTNSPVIVKVTGAAGSSYKDEATGNTIQFSATDVMRAIVPSVTTKPIAVTPVTEVAIRQVQQLATSGASGLTADIIVSAISTANNETAVRFGVTDILAPPPELKDATTDADKKYATMLTVISFIVNNPSTPINLTAAINTVLTQAISSDIAVRQQFATEIASAVTDLKTLNTTTPITGFNAALVDTITVNVVAAVDTAPTLAIADLDTIAPTAPTNLKVASVTFSEVALTWTASTDPNKTNGSKGTGVAGYTIIRDNIEIATSSLPTYTDATVAAGKTYVYSIKAFDKANNVSAASDPVSATTSAAPDPNFRDVNVSGQVQTK